MVEHYVSAELRRLVEQRARGCCEYCHSQQKYSAQSFSVEHIMPKQFGGKTIEENLALACQGCNNHKATKGSPKNNLTICKVRHHQGSIV